MQLTHLMTQGVPKPALSAEEWQIPPAFENPFLFAKFPWDLILKYPQPRNGERKCGMSIRWNSE